MGELAHGQSKLNLTDPDGIIKDIAAGTHKWRFAVYGSPKTGKSRLMDTYPINLGVIDCDSGASVYGTKGELMRAKGYRWPYSRKVISIKEAGADNLTAWQQVLDAYDYFLKDKEVDGIIWDSWSTVSDIMVYEVKRQAGTLGKQTSQPEYGKIKERTKELLHKAFASGKHTGFIFHEQTEKDELTGRIWTIPLMVGKIRDEVARYYDEFYHTQVTDSTKGFQYQIQTKACSIYRCGSRMDSKVHLETYEPSDLADLIAKVTEQCRKRVAGMEGVK